MNLHVKQRRGLGFCCRGLFLAVCVVPLFVACGKPSEQVSKSEAAIVTDKIAATEQVRVVDVVAPEALGQADSVSMNGVIAFREETRAAFKTGGVVKRIVAREGDVMKTGDVLAALDVSEIDAAVAQAQALHDKAMRDLKRGETLRAKEVIPQEALDNLRTAEQAAAAGLKAARFNRGTAELRATEPVVVLKRVAEPGEVVGAGQPVLLLGSLQSGLVFRGGLNDAQRVRLATGATAQVRLDAWPADVFDASVSELGQAADARTGAYRVELLLRSTPGKTILAGMVGRAQLPVQAAATANTWVVPLSAIVETVGEQVSVYVVNADNRVERVQLALSQLRRDRAVVQGALDAQMRVVSSGTAYLSDGDRVHVNSVSAVAKDGAP